MGFNAKVHQAQTEQRLEKGGERKEDREGKAWSGACACEAAGSRERQGEKEEEDKRLQRC